MVKKLSCKHSGVAEQIMGRALDCSWEGEAPSEDEVIEALIDHNRLAHGIDSAEPLTTVGARVRDTIEDA